jgi:hypothetical protein
MESQLCCTPNRGKVNKDGTIRLQEKVDLPTGGEVLVVVLNEPEAEAR